MIKRTIAGVVLAAMLAGTGGCATTGGASSAAQEDPWDTCKIITDVAVEIAADNYDPRVGNRDCRRQFAAAGVPMLGFAMPGQPPQGTAQRHIFGFNTPQRVGADKVIVDFSDPCPLCGHGEQLTAQLKDGRWVIIERHDTWIS